MNFYVLKWRNVFLCQFTMQVDDVYKFTVSTVFNLWLFSLARWCSIYLFPWPCFGSQTRPSTSRSISLRERSAIFLVCCFNVAYQSVWNYSCNSGCNLLELIFLFKLWSFCNSQREIFPPDEESRVRCTELTFIVFYFVKWRKQDFFFYTIFSF